MKAVTSKTITSRSWCWAPSGAPRTSAAAGCRAARHQGPASRPRRLKWSKTSASRQDFYLEVVDWFLAESPLHYRGLVVRNKQALDHAAFNAGDHDLFYYKMQFSLLSKILSPDGRYAIYLDIKDTRSRLRLKKLREVLCNNVFDFTSAMIGHIQNIHSHEAELMQLADYFTGALAYRHRELSGNAAKLAVVQRLRHGWGAACWPPRRCANRSSMCSRSSRAGHPSHERVGPSGLAAAAVAHVALSEAVMEQLYAIFRRDFIDNPARYDGCEVWFFPERSAARS